MKGSISKIRSYQQVSWSLKFFLILPIILSAERVNIPMHLACFEGRKFTIANKANRIVQLYQERNLHMRYKKCVM